jgi:hypothetical protein
MTLSAVLGSVTPTTSKVASPGYIAFYPCGQASGDTSLTDRSGKGNTATFAAGTPFSTANYFTTVASTSTDYYAVISKTIFDAFRWNPQQKDSLLLFWRSKSVTLPGSNTGIFGNGFDNTSNFGIQLRCTTGGNLQPVFYYPGATQFGSTSGSVAFGSTETTAAIFIDGYNSTYRLYVNGVKDSSIGAAAINATDLTSPSSGFRIGGYKSLNGLTGSFRCFHAIRSMPTLDLNTRIDDLVLRMHNASYDQFSALEWPSV